MNSTIATITTRALLGRRRFLLLLPLPLLMVALAIVARSLNVDPAQWTVPIVDGLGFSVVLPVVALIIGTGVLGSEIDDGTLAHILAKPLPRSQIVLTKLVVAVLATAVTVGVPLFVVGLLANSGPLAVGLAVGGLVGSLAYCALFVALSLLTRRPVVVGLVYVLVWEGLLGNFLDGTKVLSVHQYAVELAVRVSGTNLLTGRVTLATAIAMTFVFVVGGTLLAIDRLPPSFSVVGETS